MEDCSKKTAIKVFIHKFAGKLMNKIKWNYSLCYENCAKKKNVFTLKFCFAIGEDNESAYLTF